MAQFNLTTKILVAFGLAVSINAVFSGGTTMSGDINQEPVHELSNETRDMHRAIISLREELEAVDFYNQRVDACKNPELKAILAHNRDEEKEHAAMITFFSKVNHPTFFSYA
jgi:hypothetical protein